MHLCVFQHACAAPLGAIAVVAGVCSQHARAAPLGAIAVVTDVLFEQQGCVFQVAGRLLATLWT